MALTTPVEVIALRENEKEILDCLENANMNELSREGREAGVISQDVKKSLDSMDPNVPRPQKIRYLLLQCL